MKLSEMPVEEAGLTHTERPQTRNRYVDGCDLIRSTGYGSVLFTERLAALSKVRLWFWQLVAISSDPYVQGWKQENAQQQGSNQASDDDYGKGSLRVRPMPRESAAGRRPRVATSMVIMMGRSRRTAPSTAADSILWPVARS